MLFATNFAWIAVNNVIAASIVARLISGPSAAHQATWAVVIGLVATITVLGGPRAVASALVRRCARNFATASSRDGVEVLNFGVPGYNLDQEIEVLRTRALELDPDVVVIAFCLNDLEGDRKSVV